MLIEQRTYTLKPGCVRKYLEIYEREGLHVQSYYFQRMIGYFHTEVGALNQIIHIWGFPSYEQRLEARAGLAADLKWQAYAQQTRPFILAQESCFLTPATFSPINGSVGAALNLPHVVNEVKAMVSAYEKALDGNDLDSLDALMWDNDQAIRFGHRESLVGKSQISAFRSARKGGSGERKVIRQEIVTHGTDTATVAILFTREDFGEQVGRWTQSWMRVGKHWKLTCAHVSFSEESRSFN